MIVLMGGKHTPCDMNGRSLLFAAGVGAIGAVANRSLATAGEDLGPGLPGTTHTYRWRGLDVVYTTRGDPSAPDVVLAHDVGIVNSGVEFRALADELATEYHLIVPDLPGYGRSDRPPLRYSSSLYQSVLRAFLEDVPDRPTLVASGLTGSYAAEAATELPVRQVVLIGPRDTAVDRGPIRHTVLRSKGLGTAVYNAMSSRPAIRYRERTSHVYDPGAVDPDRVEYLWNSAHRPGARFAPAARLSGALDPGSDLETLLAATVAPVTLVWGREARTVPLARGRALAEATDTRLLAVDYARERPHLEHPEIVGDLLSPTRQAVT